MRRFSQSAGMAGASSLDRSYKRAVEILHARRRPGRPSAASVSDASQHHEPTPNQGTPDLRGTPSLVGMKDWLNRIGHSTADIDNLNVVHVAGTKGKGSTCAFVESFLRTFGKRTGFPKKTGLYTSPHLTYPEERIRINFQPIGRDLFAKYFFEVWEKIGPDDKREAPANIPRYLQLFALVSFHAFIREGVEAAVIETHHGGEYDATNFIEHPVATVVTTLGMDHVKQLGPTIKNIAWHKAGIFKPGALAISPPQDPSAAEVLRTRAAEKGVELLFAESDPSLPANAPQLNPEVQRINGSVALAAARHFIETKAPRDSLPLSSADIVEAVNQFSWPGRFQLVVDERMRWYLDGAHNEISINKAAQWFMDGSNNQRTSPSVKRSLIFSQISEQRDSTVVLEQLATILKSVRIDDAIFTLYSPDHDYDAGTGSKPRKSDSQEIFGNIWKNIHSNCKVHYEKDVRSAMDLAKRIGAEADQVHTLVTGSQHLVGGALHYLHLAPPPRPG
ncbi:hypothetical protein S7711_02486 [Stachybotrys chartarum IBT 7711]|uniref:tetrahydrofolate synthase n=1 Tax=Stachybotrys chartarum (strain CBS 109288 / IBT 7711) TaxID=1280523 RepID=A0A084B568_STACB|nr:hypothetical protein S7711_02486 [Stachybotrys chartarum IBT 7711]